MTTWKHALREGAITGSFASLFSAAYLAWAGHQRGQAAAPLNAVSHWVFGDRSLAQDRPSWLYTVVGYLTHHAASVFWGVLYAKAGGAREEAKRPAAAIAGTAAAASVACFVDYELTPRRFTPGFEHRLGRPELAKVYAFFALGLLVGTLATRRR